MKNRIKTVAFILGVSFLLTDSVIAQDAASLKKQTKAVKKEVNSDAQQLKRASAEKMERLKKAKQTNTQEAKTKTGDRKSVLKTESNREKDLLLKAAHEKQQELAKKGASGKVKAITKEEFEAKGKLDPNSKKAQPLNPNNSKGNADVKGVKEDAAVVEARAKAMKSSHEALGVMVKSERKAAELATKISNAKTRLNQQLAKGEITEVEFKQKESKIKLAESKLAALKSTISKEKTAVQSNIITVNPNLPKM